MSDRLKLKVRRSVGYCFQTREVMKEKPTGAQSAPPPSLDGVKKGRFIHEEFHVRQAHEVMQESNSQLLSTTSAAYNLQVRA